MPLFVRAGSILPLGPVVQHTGEQPAAPLELRIYPGANATFSLYDDDGETYAYEHGERATCELTWDDAARTLRLGARHGSFPGMTPTRRFEVRLCGAGQPAPSRSITYDGSVQSVTFPYARPPLSPPRKPPLPNP
ncbi:MAG TPA: DUF5110 domain-containing protein [Opitutaceae bacterium]|nr:DUF5110 domain-containing protein [Opitutaceae bacterium]